VDVNIHQAKTHLSRLLERVELGEEIIISRAGKPIARLAPLPKKGGKRQLGSAAGDFRTPDDFNAPLPPDIEEAFWR
jgi:prevent-host-death family protein